MTMNIETPTAGLLYECIMKYPNSTAITTNAINKNLSIATVLKSVFIAVSRKVSLKVGTRISSYMSVMGLFLCPTKNC